jgi:hypothetical protein
MYLLEMGYTSEVKQMGLLYMYNTLKLLFITNMIYELVFLSSSQ